MESWNDRLRLHGYGHEQTAIVSMMVGSGASDHFVDKDLINHGRIYMTDFKQLYQIKIVHTAGEQIVKGWRWDNNN